MDKNKAVLAKGAVVIGDVSLGEKVSVWYNAVIRGDEGHVEIGRDTNIQDVAVVHGETRIGEGCTIGHGAIVHGCTIGDNTLVGMGAIILNEARIGSNCIVGAGALVTGRTEVPDGSLVMGSPAKVVRMLTEEQISSNRLSALEYLEMAKSLMSGE